MTDVANRIPIDPTKTAIQNFFIIINAKNTKQTLTPALVSWGPPAEWSAPDDDWRNTEVILTAKPGSSWYGPAPVRYHRVDLNSFGAELQFDHNSTSTLAEILADLVLQLELVGTDVEFDVTALPDPEPGLDYVVVNLRAKDGSLLYIGSNPVRLNSIVSTNVRLEENGATRLLEDGSIRYEDSV